jgi:hypothetical protein
MKRTKIDTANMSQLVPTERLTRAATVDWVNQRFPSIEGKTVELEHHVSSVEPAMLCTRKIILLIFLKRRSGGAAKIKSLRREKEGGLQKTLLDIPSET